MEWAILKTDINKIDSRDNFFCITTKKAIKELAASITAVGIINPPILQNKNSHEFRIISGFRRIAAARFLGKKRITARVVSSEIKDSALSSIAVIDNAMQRPLNLLEEARVISLLGKELAWDKRTELIREQSGIMGNAAYLKKLESLLTLPESVQKGLADGLIGFKMGLMLKKFDKDEAKAMAGLFIQLGLSFNKQKEVLELITGISARAGISLLDVINAIWFQDILDKDIDRNQKTRLLRDVLKQKRNPNIIKVMDEFAADLKKLALPPEMGWIPPANFEGQFHTLKYRFKDKDDLVKLQNVIARITTKSSLLPVLARPVIKKSQ